MTDGARERNKDWAAETSESINARLAAEKSAQSQTRFTLVVVALKKTALNPGSVERVLHSIF